jgi:hypothetical protein
MPNQNSSSFAQNKQEAYDPRWFIWTIVFLVVTGISLVSYIVLSDTSSYDVPNVVRRNTAARQ